jgi:hypothetical protein
VQGVPGATGATGATGPAGNYQTGPGLVINAGTTPPTIDVATPYVPASGGVIGHTATPTANALLINDTAGVPQPGATGTGHLVLASEASAQLFIDSYNTNTGLGSYTVYRRARGTAAAPAVLQSGDLIGSTFFEGYNGAPYVASIAINGVATQTWTGTAAGSQLQFQTTPTGSTSVVNSLVLNGNLATFSGNVTMAGADFAMNGNAKTIESDPPGAGGYVKLYGADSGANPCIWLNSLNGQAYDSAVHNFRAAAAGALRLVIDATGTKNISGTWLTISDTRAKENIEPYTAGLSEVLALDPIRYDLIADDWRGQGHIGFAAEDVAKVMPELCSTTEASVAGEVVELQTVAPTGVVFALVNAVKELSAGFNTLDDAIKDMSRRLDALEGGSTLEGKR